MVYVIGCLSNEDSLIILQCVRLLDTLARSSDCSNAILAITDIEAIWNHLAFILKNSLSGILNFIAEL